MRVYVEREGDQSWPYIQRSAGELPETPLHSALKWVLEQLNFGNIETQRDSLGDVVSVTIGKAAAPELVPDDKVVEGPKSRLRAVHLAGLLAQCREGGIRPKHASLSKMLSLIHI